MATTKTNDPFFPSIGQAAEQTDHLVDDNAISADPENADEERPLQEIESLCMSCGEQGRTRMLLTSIPYFKEVIIMSFRCEHCGTSNNEVQSAGSVRDQGTTYTLKVLERDDLDRQLVKSATATITIPELQLTIPQGRGQLTTVEGILRDTVRDLSAEQPLRRIQDEATYTAIQKIVDALEDMVADTDAKDEDKLADEVRRKERSEKPLKPFTMVLDDPSGNSFIEFKDTMSSDAKWAMRQYNRTREQNVALGLAEEDVAPPRNTEVREEVANRDAALKALAEHTGDHPPSDAALSANDEIFVFPGICSSCGRPLDTMMKKVVIPYFKDIIIMSTNCQACGYRDNEVKSGGEISSRGKKITLKVEDEEDLGRDILKSETSSLSIPEIDLDLHPGTLGGRFTTLEGILTQVYEELSEKVFLGDSSEKFAAGTGADAGEEKKKFSTFLGDLKSVMTVTRPYTLILDDPLANSYIQNLYAPDDDPNMTVEEYDRTFEQNDDLGLNDIRLEGYEEDHKREVEEAEAEKLKKLGIDAVAESVNENENPSQP